MTGDGAGALPTLVVGEALVDVVRRRDGTTSEHVGGSPLNVAVGLARLGHPVRLATSVGADERGRRIRDVLDADGVDLVPGSDAAPRTSTATAVLDASGAADYTFDLTGEPPSAATPSGHLHTGSIGALVGPPGAAVLAAMTDARPRGTVSYDPNVRPALMGEPDAVLREVSRRVARSDVVKASDEDIAWLLGRTAPRRDDSSDGAGGEAPDDDTVVDVLRGWLGLGALLGVATLGSRGAVAVHGDRVVRVPGRAVDVADTVGAGDSFTSGLLCALLDAGLLGHAAARDRLTLATAAEVEAAVTRGVAASAITVSRPGADPPSRADLGLPT